MHLAYRTVTWPELEFRDNFSSDAWSVIEACLKNAVYEPNLRTGVFWDSFLYHESQVSKTVQSVIERKSINPGIPVFIYVVFYQLIKYVEMFINKKILGLSFLLFLKTNFFFFNYTFPQSKSTLKCLLYLHVADIQKFIVFIACGCPGFN